MFKTHLLETGPANEVETTKEELWSMYELMYTMRRMEITCDNEYKARTIRGFCHLYDGQEAVATGIQTAFDAEDKWITSYRCHCVALARGAAISEIVGELFGVKTGITQAKGGSMHMYMKDAGFYGGQGIVGAQVPVGAGLAFAQKYKAELAGHPNQMNVAVACYGDGAANQGQIWEAANMASLWKLPMIFMIENNQYGMGTSIDRHSSITEYYKMGNHIPGIQVNGNNVLSMKEAVRYAKEWAGSGNGPIYVEAKTYRYHGHSMSDPGTTYRNRDEINHMRSTSDPLGYVKELLVSLGFADEAEIKELEKNIRKMVQSEVLKAKESPRPNPETDLMEHVYATSLEPNAKSEYPAHIRMPNYEKSFWADGKMD